MKTSTQIYDQHQRMFNLFMRITTARAKRLCPGSDGLEIDPTLIFPLDTSEIWR